MAGITTHILDTARGAPARDVSIKLEYLEGKENWHLVGSGKTNSDGRCPQLLPTGHVLAGGTYRISFDTAGYFASQNVETFYPKVDIFFQLRDPHQHYHVPLLLAPWGYSTYRGKLTFLCCGEGNELELVDIEEAFVGKLEGGDDQESHEGEGHERCAQ